MIEQTQTPDEIVHPLVRETMKYLNMQNLRISYDADLPARTGLGSSSSFCVALLQAFYALKGQHVDKRRLAEDAIFVARGVCTEAGGEPDQIAAAHGGFNRINFKAEGYEINPVIISRTRKAALNERLLMIFTGISRISAEIAVDQAAAGKSKTDHLLEMLKLVDEGEKILVSDCDLSEFGRLLDFTWQLKRGLTTKISSGYIDEIYGKALKNGALGGKLLGAGGGGFLLLYAEPYQHERLKKTLGDLLCIPFEFENNGCRIQHYIPNGQWQITGG
jgi:D-glycero-alpha-D-manno-heptose-7-phosphate kinase